MSRAIDRFDRLVDLLVALVLLAGGLLVLAWGARALTWLPGHRYLRNWPQRLDTTPLVGVTEQQWWPWALLAGGVLVLLLALRHLAGHLPRRHVSFLALPDGPRPGNLRCAAAPVADAAAVALNARDGIETAYGTVHEEDGELVMKIDAVLEPDAALADIARHCDEVAAQLNEVVGRQDVSLRITLRVGNRPPERVT